ncbi:MAG: hypothetical protein ACI8R4_003788 [Paracoccaceae bacterium]
METGLTETGAPPQEIELTFQGDHP